MIEKGRGENLVLEKMLGGRERKNNDRKESV